MVTSLSNVVANFTVGFKKRKCKDSDQFLEHKSAINEHIGLSCKKNCSKKVNENLKKAIQECI